jgi:subtilisin-like proprotein convertase family protein
MKNYSRTMVGLWLGAVFMAGPANARVEVSGGGLSATALQQIQALQQEKASFTATEQKMDSQLIFAYKQSQNIPIAGGAVPNLRIGAQPDANGMLQVDITANVTTNLLQQIQNLGGSIGSGFAQYNAIRALVPVGQIENVAALADVKFVRRAAQLVRRSDPEGVFVHRDQFARTNYNVTGANVRIGVISDSVDYLSTVQAGGDLGPVTVLPGQDGVPGTGEGTAILEILYAMAPGAQLYFATCGNTDSQMAQNLLALRAAGCAIILDDIGFDDESPFQDGIIAQAVDTVTADGALYFSACGNNGNLDSTNSGTWEGNFVSGGAVGSPVNNLGGHVHSFGSVNYNIVLEPSAGSGTVLFWSDPLGAATNDYDLYDLDSTGASIVSASVTVQNGTQDPFEEVPPPNPGERLVVVLASGASRFLHLDTLGGDLTIATAGEICGHPGASNAFAVAAVDAYSAYPSSPFTGGAANPIEYYSSDGPRRVFYNPNGTAVTPGNFSSTGGRVLQKPDVSAADDVTVSTPGFSPFQGTSAATPHAAAIAALLLSRDPKLTTAQIRSNLTATALDIMGAAPNRDAGYGIVMADRTMQAAPAVQAAPDLVIATNLLSGGNGNGVIDPDECNSLKLVLANIGTTNATSVAATLSSSTPGVSVTQPASTYPNMAPGGSATNATLFQISTSPSFACGTLVEFSLVVTSAQYTVTNLLTLTTGTPGSPVQFNQNSTLAIPSANAGGVSSSLTVSNIASALTHVAVSMYIAQSEVYNLEVQLIGPDGTTVLLAYDEGLSTDANLGLSCTAADRVTFDDNAATYIGSVTGPFVGSYQPEGFLGDYIGKSGAAVNGTWRLLCQNPYSGPAGTLECWSLILTPATCTSGGGSCAASLAATSSRTNGGFTLTLTGPSGQYVFETSTNLTTWTPISTNTVSGAIQFTDTNSVHFRYRYYRAYMLP